MAEPECKMQNWNRFYGYFQNGQYAEKDVIIGVNLDEGTFWLLYQFEELYWNRSSPLTQQQYRDAVDVVDWDLTSAQVWGYTKICQVHLMVLSGMMLPTLLRPLPSCVCGQGSNPPNFFDAFVSQFECKCSDCLLSWSGLAKISLKRLWCPLHRFGRVFKNYHCRYFIYATGLRYIFATDSLVRKELSLTSLKFGLPGLWWWVTVVQLYKAHNIILACIKGSGSVSEG